MDEQFLFSYLVVGYIYGLLLVSAFSEPIASDNQNSFLDRYSASSGQQNSISSLQPLNHVEKTNSRIGELEGRLVALEAEYQAIREKNRALEQRLSEQEELSLEQRALVSTLKRIVGPISPLDERGTEIDPSHKMPFGDGRNPLGDVGNVRPPTANGTTVGNGPGSEQGDGSPDNSVGGQTSPGTQEKGVEEDLLEINEYLGNMEAQLVQLNPNGDELVQAAADDFDRVSSSPSLYGKALLNLEEQNSLLRANFEDLLVKVDEFKGRVVELLEGSNQTSNVPQMPGADMRPRDENRGEFLDEILRDLSPSNDEDLAERAASGKCGFSVAATTHQLGIQGQWQIVHFDYVFTNKGNNFNLPNSTFICAVPGYYYFSFSMRSFDNRYLGVTLMKNNDYQVAIFTDSSERSVMESQSVMIHLTTGDAVWLRLSPSSKYGLYSDQYHLTTFNGILIYKGN